MVCLHCWDIVQYVVHSWPTAVLLQNGKLAHGTLAVPLVRLASHHRLRHKPPDDAHRLPCRPPTVLLCAVVSAFSDWLLLHVLSLHSFGVAKMVLRTVYQFLHYGCLHGAHARGAAVHGSRGLHETTGKIAWQLKCY